MAVSFSTTVRNAMLDVIESTIGTSPILRIRTGTAPGIGAADSGTVLAEMTLPSDWMTAAASASKSLSGTWQDTSANATGTAGHFRIYDSTGATAHIEGSITATGGGGDMELDNTSIATGQQVTVTTFTLMAGNA